MKEPTKSIKCEPYGKENTITIYSKGYVAHFVIVLFLFSVFAKSLGNEFSIQSIQTYPVQLVNAAPL